MAASVVTLVDLFTALQRCMRAHPTQNYELHRDASLIADQWALMLYQGQDQVPREQVKPASMEAFERWALSGP